MHRVKKWSVSARRLVFLAVLVTLGSGLLLLLLSGLRPDVAAATRPEESPADAAPLAFLSEVQRLLMERSPAHPDSWTLTEDAVKGMLDGLPDKYATYFAPDLMSYYEETGPEGFGGVGVRVRADDQGYLVVVNFLPASPAERSGLAPGDRIIAIDGKSLAGLGLAGAALIRGEPGTTVVLTATREGRAEPLTFSIVREQISSPVVEWRMLTGSVGLVKIGGFDEDTDAEFDYALKDLVKSGAKAFILDLRDNPGGLLDIAENVAERLLPDNAVILRVRWATGVDAVRAHVEGDDYVPLEGVPQGPQGEFPYPVAVLVNRETASAAEILASALQEQGVARVFGERTFGKGTVQTLYPLSNGGAIRITSADWLTGRGRPVDGVGVMPDEIILAPEVAGEPTPIRVSERWVFFRGDKGSNVLDIQERLAQLGYDPGALDGLFGLPTEKALKAFQEAVGLEPSGAAYLETAQALNAARLADHPAGEGIAFNPPPPPWPDVTGDMVLDRAHQWVLGELTKPNPGGVAAGEQ